MTSSVMPPEAWAPLDRIVQELARTVAATQLALGGIRRLVRELAAVEPPPENPDPMMHVGEGDPNVQTSPHGWIRRSELIAQSAHGGGMEVLFTQQWITATYSKWEHAWRPSFAELLGVNYKLVLSNVFGDLRDLRNEILHHGGIACEEHALRCRVLSFDVGDVVSRGADDFRKIINHLDVRAETVAPATGAR